MFKKFVLPSFGILLAIIVGIISLTVLPLIMGAWTIVVLVGAIIAIIGLGFFIVAAATNGHYAWMKPTKIATFFTGLGIIVLAFAIWGTIALSSQTTQAAPTTVSITAATTTATLAVVDPALEHGNLPQEQIGHPNWYTETGTNDEYKWTFEVKTGEVGIVGGLVVDGKNGGVYRAYAPGIYTVQIQNGFALTTKAEWAQNEFEFRLGQAIQYNWAYGTVDYGPLTPPTQSK
ncbi:MAG TPA: hypothetical protein PK257_02845 [Candidatus Woesebacteria bacterium]|nr:hypothetical protein [Candidatus Woesebacteria bacterium]